MGAEHRAAIDEVASQFEPATAELLAARSLERRRDWKFVMYEAVLAEVMAMMTPSHHRLLAAGEPLAYF